MIGEASGIDRESRPVQSADDAIIVTSAEKQTDNAARSVGEDGSVIRIESPSGEVRAANAFIELNLVRALLLGMLVGQERSYNGRTAGMRTYGLVCMASTALTVVVEFAPLWCGGASHVTIPDANRIEQGVVTGTPARGCQAHLQRSLFA